MTKEDMLDRKILEDLFRQNYSKMIRLARTLLDDDEDAEDIVQDVFARLLTRESIADITVGYLMTATHHGCMNLIRQMDTRNQLRHLYPIEVEADITPTDIRMERLDEIQRFVNEQMTEPHLTVFRLRFDDGLIIKEIAERTGLAIGTVHKYLQQSIHLVQNHFKQQES